MKLAIEITDDINENFIVWLIRFIRVDILKNLNNKHLDRLNKYINNNDVFGCNRTINIKNVILKAIPTIHYRKTGSVYIIYFNSNLKLFNTEYKLTDILDFITYGNLEINGCNIISDVFNSIQYNLELYKKLYNGGYIV